MKIVGKIKAREFPRAHNIYRRWSKYLSFDKEKGIVLDGKNLMLSSVLSMGRGDEVEVEIKEGSDGLDISVSKKDWGLLMEMQI